MYHYKHIGMLASIYNLQEIWWVKFPSKIRVPCCVGINLLHIILIVHHFIEIIVPHGLISPTNLNYVLATISMIPNACHVLFNFQLRVR